VSENDEKIAKNNIILYHAHILVGRFVENEGWQKLKSFSMYICIIYTKYYTKDYRTVYNQYHTIRIFNVHHWQRRHIIVRQVTNGYHNCNT